MNQLFFDFEIGENGKSSLKNQNYSDPIRYLVYSNGIQTKFFVSEIEELGPRPVTFPEIFNVERIDEEFRLIHLLLKQINDSWAIFCESKKLRQLYYRSKRFGIREGYIPTKVRLMKVKTIKITYNSNDYTLKTLLNNIKDLDKTSTTHWNILYRLYNKVKFNSSLIEKNGFHNKRGIFEILLKKSAKKSLLGYFNGM